MAKRPRAGSRKKLTDAERAKTLLLRHAEQIRRSAPIQRLNDLGKRGEDVTLRELRQAGAVPTQLASGEFIAIANPLFRGPVRLSRWTKLRHKESGEFLEVDWDDYDLIGMDDISFPVGPIFLDPEAPWPDASAMLHAFFLACQQKLQELKLISPPTRSYRSYDADLLHTLDVYRQMTAERNGRPPSFADLGRALGVSDRTASNRLKRARDAFADTAESELEDLISQQRRDIDRGDRLSGGRNVKYDDNRDIYDAPDFEPVDLEELERIEHEDD